MDLVVVRQTINLTGIQVNKQIVAILNTVLIGWGFGPFASEIPSAY